MLCRKGKRMLQDLREIMGLSIEQVADELSLSKEQVLAFERVDDERYFNRFIEAFPINRRVLRYHDADPFLSSYDQTSPGKRLSIWMLEHNISASEIAYAINQKVTDVLGFIQGSSRVLSKSEGELIEKNTGINRKWLMYGDGRQKGNPVSSLIRGNGTKGGEGTILERIASDFEKLPDVRIRTRAEERAEKKALGQKVRNARKMAQLTIQEAADILNISASRVGQLECGIISERKADEVLKLLADYVEACEEKDRAEKEIDIETATNDTDTAHVEEVQETYEEIADKEIRGIKIREARENAHLTVKEAAEVLEVSRGRISQMEHGMLSPQRAKEVIKIFNEHKTDTGVQKINGKSARRKSLNGLTCIQLGTEIYETRKAAGYSQKMVGDIIGKSQTKISQIEKGKVTQQEAERIISLIANISS